MKISAKTRYGIKALSYMAIYCNQKSYTPLKKIANFSNVSEKYLEKLLGDLRHNGIIKTHRGANGGYMLSRDPSNINLYQIIMALEKDIIRVDCISDNCNNHKCISKSTFHNIKHDLTILFSRYTLQEIIKNQKKD